MSLILNDDLIRELLDNSQVLDSQPRDNIGTGLVMDSSPEQPNAKDSRTNVTCETPREPGDDDACSIMQIALGKSMDDQQSMSGSSKQKPARQVTNKGRPRDPIHSEFIWLDSGKALCPACSVAITGRVDVMKAHKKACKGHKPVAMENARLLCKNPSAFRNQLQATPKAQGNSKAPRKRLNFENWEEVPVSKKPLRNFLDGISQNEKEDLHIKCAKFMYACNLPFRVVENPEFRDFMSSLRPAYKPPSREEIGGRLLDQVYKDVKDKVTNSVSGKDVVLAQDGWSTSQSQPVIAHSVHCGDKVHFLNATPTGTDIKSAEYCMEKLETAMGLCENDHQCNVIGIVTDNCNVMQSLRSLVRTKYPAIITYGCTVYYLNCVGKKVTPASKLEDILKVQKYFKNHHFQSAALLALKGKRPVLPGCTRWNSQLDCLANYLENHTKYLDIARRNPKQFDVKIVDIIKTNKIYDDAVKMLENAKPIAVSLDKAQSNAFSIAQAVGEWIHLRNVLKLTKDQKEYFTKKMKEALIGPVIAAHILDPRFRGEGLSTFELENGYDWLRSMNPELVVMAMELEAKNEEKFPRYLLENDTLGTIDPKTFWTIVGKRGGFPNDACNMAENLMKLRASASGLERCFSTMSLIYSRNRNKLQVEKAGKLCTIYGSLRCLSDEDFELDVE